MVPDHGGDTAEAGSRSSMRAFLDTNTLIRHLAGDPPTRASFDRSVDRVAGVRRVEQ